MAKPLKRCLRCFREWFMLDDVCMECEDKYARAKWRTQCGIDRARFGYDTQGVEMNTGD